jgi:hypothetical protein
MLDYLLKTFYMWFETLLATDRNNPHYRYLWLPPIGNRYVGVVMCDEKNITVTHNEGPVCESKLREL